MEQSKYSIVFYEAKKELGITLTEYCLLDIVKLLQMKTGFCYASKKYLAESLDISEKSVFNLIKKLVELGLLVKSSDNSQFLKVSDKFIEITTQINYEKSSYNQQNLPNDYEKSSDKPMKKVHNDYEKSSYNNYTYNSSNKYKNNNILPKFQNFESYNQYLESLDKNSNEYYLLLNIQNKYPNISKLENQMTFENAKNLINTYSKEDIIEVLNSMENTKGLSKKYISVYLTLNKWLQNHIKFNKGTKNEKIKSDYEKRRSLDLDEVQRNYEKLYGSE